MWSAKESDSSSADHLVVMVHGIMGRSAFSISSPTIQFLPFHSNRVESLPLLSSVCLDV